ncbi:hypothetical protein Pelo_7842 [Pelomyxa schiedti]|nr:hypothetical protein Pelo_7842 [Pelomyxa schiedti]
MQIPPNSQQPRPTQRLTSTLPVQQQQPTGSGATTTFPQQTQPPSALGPTVNRPAARDTVGGLVAPPSSGHLHSVPASGGGGSGTNGGIRNQSLQTCMMQNFASITPMTPTPPAPNSTLQVTTPISTSGVGGSGGSNIVGGASPIATLDLTQTPPGSAYSSNVQSRGTLPSGSASPWPSQSPQPSTSPFSPRSHSLPTSPVPFSPPSEQHVLKPFVPYLDLPDQNQASERRTFFESLSAFLRESAGPTVHDDKIDVDLFLLYREVNAYKGGFATVVHKNLWEDISKKILPPNTQCPAYKLRTNYLRYLYNYECKQRTTFHPTGVSYPNKPHYFHPLMEPLVVNFAEVSPQLTQAFSVPSTEEPKTIHSIPNCIDNSKLFTDPIHISNPRTDIEFPQAEVFYQSLINSLDYGLQYQIDWALHNILSLSLEGKLYLDMAPGLVESLMKVVDKRELSPNILVPGSSVTEEDYQSLLERVFETSFQKESKVLSSIFYLSQSPENIQALAKPKVYIFLMHVISRSPSQTHQALSALAALSKKLAVDLIPQEIFWQNLAKKLYHFASSHDAEYVILALTTLKRIAKTRKCDQFACSLGAPFYQSVSDLLHEFHNARAQSAILGALCALVQCGGEPRHGVARSQHLLHSLVRTMLGVAAILARQAGAGGPRQISRQQIRHVQMAEDIAATLRACCGCGCGACRADPRRKARPVQAVLEHFEIELLLAATSPSPVSSLCAQLLLLLPAHPEYF